MELKEVLQKYTNYKDFRPGQEEVISSVVNGRDTLAMLPTGTGKSLCYQLPGYILPGQVLIVSPLLSLMQDQVEQMKMKGEKRVVAINSFLTPEQKKTVLSGISNFKFVFLSPEMLGMDGIITVLKQQRISLFVIDEAHCISQWGYDFRPDYLKLGAIRQQLGSPVTLALTATATKEVREDIIVSLHLKNYREVIYSVDRPNIAIQVEKIPDQSKKMDRLRKLVQELRGPGIIYFSSKRMAEQTAMYLSDVKAANVSPYHGGMDTGERILIQQQFIKDQLDVICATSAFGMGINKENIRYIIHYHMPLEMESYLQEIGRAGRDGEKSIAILLYSPGDELLANHLSEAELPSIQQIETIRLLYNNSLLNSINEEEWKRNNDVTDIQWRIIREFLDFSVKDKDEFEVQIENLQQYIKRRVAYKRSKIASMVSWIYSDSCRRNSILSYFSEEPSQTRKADCCDLCGIQLHHFLSEGREKTLETEPPFNWKQYLSEILLT
jgi:ATP-dependent DNA helicase RecQ